MYRKNTASQFVCFQLLLTATGAVATGLSPAVRRCIDGTFAAGGGTFTEDGATGSYKYAMAQADTNGNDISLVFSAATAMPVCVNFVTTAADPTDGVRLGLTALPNAAANAAGGLPVSSAGALDLDEMNVDIEAIQASTAALTFTVANQVDVNVVDWKGATAPAMPANFASLSITAAGLVAVTSNVKKNAALNGFTFVLTDSTTHNPKTGVTVTAQRSLDGGALGACANSVSEISNGLYQINLAAGDLNANVVLLRFTGASTDDRDILIITQS